MQNLEFFLYTNQCKKQTEKSQCFSIYYDVSPFHDIPRDPPCSRSPAHKSKYMNSNVYVNRKALELIIIHLIFNYWIDQEQFSQFKMRTHSNLIFFKPSLGASRKRCLQQIFQVAFQHIWWYKMIRKQFYTLLDLDHCIPFQLACSTF